MTPEEKNKYKNMDVEVYDTKANDPYIFASYSRANELYVKKALNDLVNENFRIWYDTAITEEGEKNFKDVLQGKIENCAAMLLFISAQSMDSDWCGREILEAYRYNKKLRCFALLEDDNIENSEYDVMNIVPKVLHSYVCDNYQIVTYEMKGQEAEDDSEAWKKSMEGLMAILPDETRQALEYEDEYCSIVNLCRNNKKHIELPDSARVIKEYVFRDRENLMQFDFANVERIEDGAFEGCKTLDNLQLPNSVKYFGEYVFKDCEQLKKITLGEDTAFLGEGMFDGCVSLENIVLPDKIVDIPTGLFNGCTGLINISLPKDLKTIGESAFENCKSLTFEDDSIFDEVRIIDDQAFANCDSLETLTLPSKLLKLGKSVFRDCDLLKKIRIGKEVSYIGSSPFRGCVKLQLIDVNDRNRFFRATLSDGGKGTVLYNKNRSELICFPAGIEEDRYKIPDSVTTISGWAFAYSKLSSIEISDSVDVIKENAFFKCKNLEEIRLPDGVTVLDNMAFRKCEKLKRVFIPDSVNKIGYAVFAGCGKVQVVCESEDSVAYKSFFDQRNINCICQPELF